MSLSSICFEHVSKRYRLGSGRSSLREALTTLPRRLLSWGGNADDSGEHIWALKDVTFDVQPGGALGIIGPNGAGKTTILKLLARITHPTEGYVGINGRVASLIELGAGFHPDLTGHENVYLNGVILGLSRQEVAARFKNIVDFAELWPFIDTPVKRYSSGMYARLGFSVAAHVDPEILLVDEVLAVGDIGFQNKCFARMQAFRENEGTVILVSHNLSAITALCDRAIWLEQGKIQSIGKPTDVVEAYLADYDRKSREESDQRLAAEDLGTGDLRVTKVVLFNQDGVETDRFRFGEDLGIRVYYRAIRPVKRPYLMIGVVSKQGGLFAANMLFDGQRPERLEGDGVFECVFKAIPLLPGNYQITGGARGEGGVLHILRPRLWATFSVISEMADYGFSGAFGQAVSRDSTPVLVPYEWRFDEGKRRFVYDPRRYASSAGATKEEGTDKRYEVE